MTDKDFEKFITNSLDEDLGDGDHSSLASIPHDATNKAHLIVKDEGIIAGVALAKMIFNKVDSSLKIETILSDGNKVKFGDVAFIVEGKSISILTAERLVLNCMQRMSAIATKTSLKIADYVVTEAGFGADLGAEKFLNIKCRKAGLEPNGVVLVATIRALKMHGGVKKEDLGNENVDAVRSGISNLNRHVNNIKKFGLPVIVAINHFVADTENEMKALQEECNKIGVESVLCQHWAKGGDGAVELAKKVVDLVDQQTSFKFLYEDKIPLFEKIKTIAKEIYDASEVIANNKIRSQLKQFEENGYGDFPICIAKTQYSFTADPENGGLPQEHNLPVKEIRVSAGAEFVVVICGDIMLMPGLPKTPAAESIYIDENGLIQGLF